MAELQLTYRIGRCLERRSEYCEQCHTCAADYMGCKGYDAGKHDPYVIPFGDCINAVFDIGYVGTTTNRYQMEKSEDPYNQHLNCMEVKLGRKTYECTKVVLDGKCIYNAEAD